MRRLLVPVALVAALWLAPGALGSGWCGSGESGADRADVVTGRQVHALWVVPSDRPDSFAAGAARLADDVASITSWWQGQDPTRVPRLDVAAFPGGTCADISFVRLPRPAAEYTGAGAAFRFVAADLVSAGFDSPFKKYLVYFDGPSVEANVCGTGSGDFQTGPSFAVVWLGGCSGVFEDNVAAHELLHALGALPDGAPHACPGDPGHPCDSMQDILYPFNDGAPLAQEVLDVGHDDYYGHSGTWIDIQDSPWLHLLGVAPLPLTVAFSGAGSVTSDVPGVSCAATCTTQWDPGSKLDLRASGSPTTRFVRWAGTCSGSLGCAVTVDGATSVSAVFGPLRVPVTVSASGKGAIRCTPRCSTSFPAGTRLTLQAVPAKGWRFLRWSGACTGTRPVCRPKTDFAVRARAAFRRR